MSFNYNRIPYSLRKGLTTALYYLYLELKGVIYLSIMYYFIYLYINTLLQIFDLKIHYLHCDDV